MGSGCTSDFKVNDQIMGLVSGGGYAEFCLADERTLMHAIPGIPPDVLAAIPEAFMTAYQLCFKLANIQKGESVLLHAAASSVGQAAIQMLTLKGCRVYCTVRGEAKRQRCSELGAVAATVIDFPTDLSFSEWAVAANDGPIDVILDPVGSAYMQENVAALGLDALHSVLIPWAYLL
jgi:NADPH:quinone reductase-like Zn-dependent oxidoreductase